MNLCGCNKNDQSNLSDNRSSFWIKGHLNTVVGSVPRVDTNLKFRDKLGHYKVRWGIGRNRYTIQPGLYSVGNPDSDSPVLVSANYKMSFDLLRQNLAGRNAWILVLDTRGVNVWCAAGKGTFGTDEVIRQVRETKLNQIVEHKKLIIPQLGAPGVAAHTVKKETGFRVIYGPIRVTDLNDFLDNGNKATPEMRKVNFPIRDRLVLTPMELVGHFKYILGFVILILAVSGFNNGLFAWTNIVGSMASTLTQVGLATFAGIFLLPVLLPIVPTRPFSLKGFILGMISLIILWIALPFEFQYNLAERIAWLLMISAIASFTAMNFTGCSTFTSLSGVQKEMRFAVPMQIVGIVGGFITLTITRFV